MLDTVSREAPLHGDGAAERVDRPLEGGEDPVSGAVHDLAAVLGDRLLDEAIVPFEQMAPGLIADRCQQRRGLADVGEHECSHRDVGGRTRCCIGCPLRELITDRARVRGRSDAELGIQPDKPPYEAYPGGSRITFVTDPDGYRIELIERR